MNQQLYDAAQLAITKCLGVRPGETVLVIADKSRESIGRALWQAAEDVGADAVLCLVKARGQHGAEPPVGVAEAMKKADVVLCPTSWSLSHTKARKAACEAGARIATLPSITEEIMGRAVNTDYELMAAVTEKLAAMLTHGAEAHLTTPAGTDLYFSLSGRQGQADTGILTAPGSFGNLPAGEAFIAPQEGTATGTVVVDGSMAGIGKLAEPLTLRLERGLIVEFDDMDAGQKLKAMMEPLGQGARNFAELGIGTNKSATLTGNVLEDEKVWGTVHVAFGSNATFGGTVHVPLHLDGVMCRPTLTIDRATVIEDGEFKL